MPAEISQAPTQKRRCPRCSGALKCPCNRLEQSTKFLMSDGMGCGSISSFRADPELPDRRGQAPRTTITQSFSCCIACKQLTKFSLTLRKRDPVKIYKKCLESDETKQQHCATSQYPNSTLLFQQPCVSPSLLSSLRFLQRHMRQCPANRAQVLPASRGSSPLATRLLFAVLPWRAAQSTRCIQPKPYVLIAHFLRFALGTEPNTGL